MPAPTDRATAKTACLSILQFFNSSIFPLSLIPEAFASFMSNMAGFLALPDKSAFPTLFTIRSSLLISAAPVASSGLTIIGITVAGTAQVFHLIPFYCADETPAHHHFGCKGTNK